MDDRADKKKADDPFTGSGGGGAVDDLTPPTMKYGPGMTSSHGGVPLDVTLPNNPSPSAPAGDLTRLGATQIATPKTQHEKPDFTAARPANSINTSQLTTVVGDVVAQDLSSEK